MNRSCVFTRNIKGHIELIWAKKFLASHRLNEVQNVKIKKIKNKSEKKKHSSGYAFLKSRLSLTS